MFPRRFATPPRGIRTSAKFPKRSESRACVCVSERVCIRSVVRDVNRSYAMNEGKLEHSVACSLYIHIWIINVRAELLCTAATP